ncbi:MAG: hypothetical protein HUJ65_03655, partial [Oscillospiraceae bacterium]|nr:hypothetical protein [Oscillospiraceae bacterium]
CRHNCCMKWEIDVDEASLSRFMADPDIARHIDKTGTPHIRLDERGRCPFLTDNNLCSMVLKHGKDFLCLICRDHPRFISFWSDRAEFGLGIVCEEAGRIILGRQSPMRLVELNDDGGGEALPEDEAWLLEFRYKMLSEISETGPRARLLEYLIYRHIPDALYDDRLEERVRFVEQSFYEITKLWDKTDGSLEAIVDCTRAWSFDVEYDDEELEKRIKGV